MRQETERARNPFLITHADKDPTYLRAASFLLAFRPTLKGYLVTLVSTLFTLLYSLNYLTYMQDQVARYFDSPLGIEFLVALKRRNFNEFDIYKCIYFKTISHSPTR